MSETKPPWQLSQLEHSEKQGTFNPPSTRSVGTDNIITTYIDTDYVINNPLGLSVQMPDLPHIDQYGYIQQLFKAVMTDVYTFQPTKHNKCRIVRLTTDSNTILKYARYPTTFTYIRPIISLPPYFPHAFKSHTCLFTFHL